MQRRILLLITDLRIGGTPTVLRELAIRLNVDPDFAVQVACLDRWGPVADQLRGNGVGITALDASCGMDLRVVGRLIRLIRQENIDTVFSFLIHANTVAAIASFFCPGVRFLQSIQTTQPNPRWHWVVQYVIQRRARKVIVPSKSAADVAVEWAGVKPEKLIVISNAVEISDFAGKRVERNGMRIGFVGRLDPIKHVEDLVTALLLLKGDYTLDIFGEGAERKHIQDAIKRLGLEGRVVMHGAIAGSAQALEKIDVLVLPSDAEGFGLVLIEAMAAGVPVIGTNVPGIRDVVEDGISGLLVPPRNPEAITDAIQKVCTDPVLRAQLIDGGRDRVRTHFQWSSVMGRYRDLLLGC